MSEMSNRITPGILHALRVHNYLPVQHTIVDQRRAGAEVMLEASDRWFLDFTSNNYLSLSYEPEVIAAVHEANLRFGVGSGGSRVTRTHALHRELERAVARFKGRESAMVFTTGFHANESAVASLLAPTLFGLAFKFDRSLKEMRRPVAAILDTLDHASIYEGVAKATSGWYGKVKWERFRHRDVSHLRQIMSKLRSEDNDYRLVLLLDGVYSLQGDITPREIFEVAREFGAEVYLDDAHGTGVLGQNGRGTAELLNVEDIVTYSMGTLSKAFGIEGGFLAADADIIDELRYDCRAAVFQTAMPPGLAAGLIKAIEIAQREPDRRRTLLEKAVWVRAQLAELEFDTLGSETQIIPVLLGSVENVKRAQTILHENHILALPHYAPAVPEGKAIIRVNLMHCHTGKDLVRLIAAFRDVRDHIGVI